MSTFLLLTDVGQRQYYNKAMLTAFDFVTATAIIVDFCVDMRSVQLESELELDFEPTKIGDGLNCITSCALSHDGQLVAAGSLNSTLKLWSNLGECLTTFEGHKERIVTCAFTPEGKLVSGSEDKTMKLWDTVSQKCTATFGDHESCVTACAPTVDGLSLISGTWWGNLRLWDLESEKPVTTFRGHNSYIKALAVTGETVISASFGQSIKLWNWKSGKCFGTMKGHRDAINDFALTPDGLILVSASNDKSLKVWDLRMQKCLATLGLGPRGHRLHTCNIILNGATAISSSKYGVHVFNLQSFKYLRAFNIDGISGCALNPTGSTLLTSHESCLKLWGAKFKNPPFVVIEPLNPIDTAIFK